MASPPGPHMEAVGRVKAVYDTAAKVTVNPDTHPKHYLRSGRELLRSAASYQEDGQTEHAYILYVRFLTIFIDKLRQHPNYKDVPQTERKIMTEYCNKVLPQAEYLKKQLLDQYKQEHDAYLENQSRMQAIAIANAANNEEENSKYGGLSKDTQRGSLIQPRETELAPSSQLPFGGVEYSPKTTGEGTKPANLYGIYNEADNTHYLPKDSGSELISPNPTPTAPSFDRSIKPHRFITSISTGIRPLVIPAELAQTFLRHVQLNTSKNVESCGLLTGKINGAGLVITDLIIPKQSGSSDTCTMHNETDIFALQDKYNLITFGWIHTHPSQSAFLSSIDMHTHYSYQVMMPEAVAVVCAPTHNQTGTFTLTSTGMDEIGGCKENGFHPHKTMGLFEDASHCTTNAAMSLKVHDLR